MHYLTVVILPRKRQASCLEVIHRKAWDLAGPVWVLLGSESAESESSRGIYQDILIEKTNSLPSFPAKSHTRPTPGKPHSDMRPESIHNWLHGHHPRHSRVKRAPRSAGARH